MCCFSRLYCNHICRMIKYIQNIYTAGDNMPFEIVRNDITNIYADAIVNAANPKPVIGYGVDAGIHKKAGPKLLEAREKIGSIQAGQAAVTQAYGLNAKFVIHAVGPVWQDGKHGEEKILRQCYDNALRLAAENNCESVAFPLLSAGNHGFPKALALNTAISAFSSFLMEHDMTIYLAVFSRDAFELSEKLFKSVKSYIDENYITDKTLDEYGVKNKADVREAEIEEIQKELRIQMRRCRELLEEQKMYSLCAPSADSNLEKMLENTEDGFSAALLKLIDRTGKKDSEIYKKANVDRKLFSKIRNNPEYRPSKSTALAFAIALELDIDETRELLGSAGYALTHSSKADIIAEYFINNKNYDIFELNEVLFAFDQPLIGS